MDVERFSIMHNGKEQNTFDTILEHARTLGFIKDTDRIYGFREEQRKKLPKDHTWINFLDYVTYCYHQADHAGQLSGRVVIDRALNRISTDFTNYFIQGYDKIEQRLMDGNFKTYIKKLYDMDSEAHDLDHDAVKGLQAHLNIVDTSEDQVDKLLEEWACIKDYFLTKGQVESDKGPYASSPLTFFTNL